MKKQRSKKKTIAAVIAAVVVTAAAVFAFAFRRQIYEKYFAPELPLTITGSPVDVTVESGYPAVFTVKAQGNGLTYSWESISADGSSVKIKGKIGDTLSLVTDMSMNGKRLRCTVTDRNGASKISESALLTVSKDHTYGEMLVTKENTCLDEGEATYVCTSCGAKKTEILPAKGHSFDESVSYTGKRRFVCRVCAYSFETDAADKAPLDTALAKIPEYVGVYYEGSAAKTLLSIREKLNTSVYGVKNYDLLSQKESDDYAKRIEQALGQLELKKTDGKNIYITAPENGSAYISAVSGKTVEAENAEATLTSAGFYTKTEKDAYYLTLPEGKSLFSLSGRELLLLSGAQDPTLMRTPLVYNAASRLGIDEAPDYGIAEVYLNGKYLGAYVVREAPEKNTSDAEKLQEEIIALFSSDKSYDEIKKRVDTARFARYVILYCLFGFHDSISTANLLYEQDGLISVHLPVMCDGVLSNNKSQPFVTELEANAVTASLIHNGDFVNEVRLVYGQCSEKLLNLCTAQDEVEIELNENASASSSAASTPEESTEEATKTAENAASAEEKDGDEKTASDGGTESGSTALTSGSENNSAGENGESVSAISENLSSFGRLYKNYGSVFERSLTEGAVTYDDSFGTITRLPSFPQNALALAKALLSRLNAAG